MIIIKWIRGKDLKEKLCKSTHHQRSPAHQTVCWSESVQRWKWCCNLNPPSPPRSRTRSAAGCCLVTDSGLSLWRLSAPRSWDRWLWGKQTRASSSPYIITNRFPLIFHMHTSAVAVTQNASNLFKPLTIKATFRNYYTEGIHESNLDQKHRNTDL